MRKIMIKAEIATTPWKNTPANWEYMEPRKVPDPIWRLMFPHFQEGTGPVCLVGNNDNFWAVFSSRSNFPAKKSRILNKDNAWKKRFSSANVQLDIAKNQHLLPNVWLFRNLKTRNTVTRWPRTLELSERSWSVGKTRVQIHHCPGLFLNVTGHSSRSLANFATAPVTSTLWVSGSQIPAKKTHDLDDLGYHFRSPYMFYMVITCHYSIIHSILRS